MLLSAYTAGSQTRRKPLITACVILDFCVKKNLWTPAPQRKSAKEVVFVAVPINAVVLEQGKHRHTESIQTANSHTLTSKEGWLRCNRASELLQVMRMKVLQPTRQKTTLHTPVATTKTHLWIQCLWVGLFFWGGGRLPSYKSLGRGWDVTKLPGLSQKRSSKARVRPISWWNTYLQDISNNPFNSPHHGCLSRSSTSQGSPPGLPREPLQPHWGPWHQFRPSFLQHSGTWSTNRHLWRIQPSQLASWLVCICITEALMIWDKTRALKCFSSLRSCTLPSLQLHKPQRSPFLMSSSGRHRGTNHPSTLLP